MQRIWALALSIFFTFPAVSSVDALPAVQSPLASQSLLLDIAKVSERKLVAVGQHGHILTSTDALNWQQARVPVQSTLTGVYFFDDNLGWAVGHDATILNTTDGGQTWTIQQFKPELEKPLFDIVFKDEKHGIALGAYGQLFRTSDGGQSWTNEFHAELLHPDDIDYLEELKLEDEEAYLDETASILPHFNRVYVDGRTLYLVGEIGLIAKSNDFGVTWQKLDEIYQGSFFDITRTQKGNLLVAGLRGNVFRSLKNGAPWQRTETDTTALLSSIILSDDDRLFIVGTSGMILESRDDGKTFAKKTQADGKAIVAGVWFKGQLVVVSEVGVKQIGMTK